MKYFLSLIVLFSFISSAQAQNLYITGITKITLRTGADNTHKIIRMLDADAKVQLLEEGAEWSKIKDDEGNEGWVMNRFLQKEIPTSVRYQWLKAEHEKLKTSQQEVKNKHDALLQEFNNLKKELSQTQNDLKTTKTDFEELKKGSSEYLQLKSIYDQSIVDLKKQTDKVKELESKLIPHYIYWFLAGAGVLLLGWLIGMTARKRNSYSSRIRL